jgi:hypothetical protein
MPRIITHEERARRIQEMLRTQLIAYLREDRHREVAEVTEVIRILMEVGKEKPVGNKDQPIGNKDQPIPLSADGQRGSFTQERALSPAPAPIPPSRPTSAQVPASFVPARVTAESKDYEPPEKLPDYLFHPITREYDPRLDKDAPEYIAYVNPFDGRYDSSKADDFWRAEYERHGVEFLDPEPDEFAYQVEE